MSAPLIPDHYPQLDLFVRSLSDIAPRGDIGSLEHPVFALSPNKGQEPKHYQRNGYKLEVRPSTSGFATIHDRDVIIYAISLCVEELDKGGKISRKIRFLASDFLKATNRSKGYGYKQLKQSLERLQGTQIITNITQGGKVIDDIFGLLTSARIVREEKGAMEIEVVLNDWIMDAIKNNYILTFHPDYFRLRKGLERRLYELARKYCGDGAIFVKGGYFKNKVIKINLDTLQEKCGSTTSPKEFIRMLKKIIKTDKEHNYIPDYEFRIVKRQTKESLKGLDAWQVAILPKNLDRFHRKSEK